MVTVMRENCSQPIVLDLFCGAGGMSLGFQSAGYKVGLGVEMEKHPAETHKFNFDGRCVQADIQTLVDCQGLLKAHDVSHVDIIVGGPPCQGFSKVGRGKIGKLNNDPLYYKYDPRNKLWQEFFRFVVVLEPAWFVMENVPDLASYDDGTGLLIDTIIHEFEVAKYTVEWRILQAAEYGVPQMRKRLFVVGNRSGLPIPWPEPVIKNSVEYITVWDAIADLPIVNIKHRLDEVVYFPSSELGKYALQMREGAADKVFGHLTRWHRDDDLEAFRLLEEGGKYIDLPERLQRYRTDIFSDRFSKLRREKPSWTLEAHMSKDTYRYIYPTRDGDERPDRTISVREAARLQSFPDRFRFSGKMCPQFRQVGNAVPPLLAKAVAASIYPHIFS